MKVGFVGLGAMGAAMARNLLHAGHEVLVWNRSPGPAQALAAEGAAVAATPADAAQGDALITMLANDEAVRAVYLDGLLDRVPTSVVHVNCSTVSVALTTDLIEQHRARDLAYVAAPVFGRPDVAAAGQLHIVAAGPAAALRAVQPLFDAMGQKTWPVGEEPVRSAVVKISGNMMIASAIESMAEATALGAAHGLAPDTMLDIYTNTIFDCRVYKSYGAQIAARRYEPAGFVLALGLKDIRLALAAGDAANVPLPVASVLRDAMISAVAEGDGHKDWSALADVALRRAGRLPEA